jgi:hypothetical protein
VAIISYGTQGGSLANEQLSGTLGKVMKMEVAPTKILLPFSPGADVMSAINDGVLGEESMKAWKEAGKKEQILEAFAEIKEVLEQSKE